MVATQDLQLLSVGILLLCDVIIVVGMKSDIRAGGDRSDVSDSRDHDPQLCHHLWDFLPHPGG